MRSEGDMMIVVDEYGGTAGLVSLEDCSRRSSRDPRRYDQAEEEPLQILSPTEALSMPGIRWTSSIAAGLGINESGEVRLRRGYVVALLGTIRRPVRSSRAGVRSGRSSGPQQPVELVRLISPQPWPDDALVEAGFQPAKLHRRSPSRTCRPSTSGIEHLPGPRGHPPQAD